MDVNSWAPLPALCGVVVGSVVTFVGQFLTRRQTSSLSIAQQRAELRKDRREAIYQFLQAAQRVHAIATSDPDTEEALKTSGKIAAEADLLYRQKCVDVVCRPELRTAANQYANALNGILWSGKIESKKAFENIAQAEQTFFELARTELYARKVSD